MLIGLPYAIGGVDVSEHPIDARKNLGFAPQHLTLLDYLTGLEYLQFVADLRDVTGSERDTQIDELLAIGELGDARHVILREYSGGMLRKGGLSPQQPRRPIEAQHPLPDSGRCLPRRTAEAGGGTEPAICAIEATESAPLRGSCRASRR